MTARRKSRSFRVILSATAKSFTDMWASIDACKSRKTNTEHMFWFATLSHLDSILHQNLQHVLYVDAAAQLRRHSPQDIS